MLYSWDESNVNYSSNFAYFPPPAQGGSVLVYEQIPNTFLYYTAISNSENLNNYINPQGLFDFSNASPTNGTLTPDSSDRDNLPLRRYCIIGLSSLPYTGEHVYTGTSSTFPVNVRRTARNGLYDWYLTTGTNSGSANTGRVYSINSSKGSYIQSVYSINENQYPVNGTQGGYWYKLERRNKS